MCVGGGVGRGSIPRVTALGLTEYLSFLIAQDQ